MWPESLSLPWASPCPGASCHGSFARRVFLLESFSHLCPCRTAASEGQQLCLPSPGCERRCRLELESGGIWFGYTGFALLSASLLTRRHRRNPSPTGGTFHRRMVWNRSTADGNPLTFQEEPMELVPVGGDGRRSGSPHLWGLVRGENWAPEKQAAPLSLCSPQAPRPAGTAGIHSSNSLEKRPPRSLAGCLPAFVQK